MRGFDPNSFEQAVSRDNNTKGFVRAVLCQLFPHLKKIILPQPHKEDHF